jgi:hypothetical protein
MRSDGTRYADERFVTRGHRKPRPVSGFFHSHPINFSETFARRLDVTTPAYVRNEVSGAMTLIFPYFKNPCSTIVSLLLPASAKCPVELYETLELVAAVLRQGQLGAEQRALIVKDLEIGGDAAGVALE